MIRYFTNYSFGGYEELYLGSNADQEEYRFHLPLLENKKARLADDPSNKRLADEVERLSQYVLIQKNGKTPEGTLPEEALTIISNGGYDVICRRVGRLFVVAVSDVASEDHDEMGGGMRENPFTMLFVFDLEDANVMDALLDQLLKKEKQWRDLISSLFTYDPIANGLRFSLGELNSAIKALESTTVTGFNHQADVPLIVLEKNFKLDYALEVQKLEGKKVGAAYDDEGNLLKQRTLPRPTQILHRHKGTDVVSKNMTTPEPTSGGGENIGQVPVTNEGGKEQKESDQTGIEIPPSGDGNNPQPPVVNSSPSKEEIEAKLRPIIRAEEREIVSKELRQEYQRKMEEKEQEFLAERKKLIYMAIGAAIGAFILGALLFK